MNPIEQQFGPRRMRAGFGQPVRAMEIPAPVPRLRQLPGQRRQIEQALRIA